MRKGFSLLELLIAVALLVPFLIVVGFWSKSFFTNAGSLKKFYADRNILINKVELKEGSERKVSANLYLKTVSQNALSVEYMVYR